MQLNILNYSVKSGDLGNSYLFNKLVRPLLRFSVDAMIAKSPFRPSDVLPTLVFSEQLENSDRHRRDVGDQQHADAQYD